MAKKTQGASSEEAPQRMEPLKIFRIDDVSASVFTRRHEVSGEMKTFYSVSFSRSYRDSDGKRRYVKTFNLDDLGKVITVAQQADEYIRSLMDE